VFEAPVRSCTPKARKRTTNNTRLSTNGVQAHHERNKVLNKWRASAPSMPQMQRGIRGTGEHVVAHPRRASAPQLEQGYQQD
jgi:hypothetical protein